MKKKALGSKNKKDASETKTGIHLNTLKDISFNDRSQDLISDHNSMVAGLEQFDTQVYKNDGGVEMKSPDKSLRNSHNSDIL